MKKFTLPAGTSNRHQWHKAAASAITKVTRTFNQRRQLGGTLGVDEHECLVSIFSFGADQDQNTVAIEQYNKLGEQFSWTITRDNAEAIAEAFKAALPACVEAIPVEDNRKTPDERAEQAERYEKQHAENQAKASEKAARVEQIAAKLRKQYPNAISAGKSSHARAAANFKQILQAMGLRASVTSESYSMGNSVNAKVLTPDLTPAQREEIESLRHSFTYGTFDAMTDCSGYDHSDHGEAWELVLGRSKHCFVEFTQSDENKAAIAEFLGDENTDNYGDNAGYRVWTGAHHSADEFWAKWTEDHATTAPALTATGYSIEEHTHTKRGFQMFIVIPAERLERDDFNRLRDAAKTAGGWYSRKWGSTPGGFAFKDKDAAEQFAANFLLQQSEAA